MAGAAHRRNWCPEHGYWQNTAEAIPCPAASCGYYLRYGPLAPDRCDRMPNPLNPI